MGPLLRQLLESADFTDPVSRHAIADTLIEEGREAEAALMREPYQPLARLPAAAGAWQVACPHCGAETDLLGDERCAHVLYWERHGPGHDDRSGVFPHADVKEPFCDDDHFDYLHRLWHGDEAHPAPLAMAWHWAEVVSGADSINVGIVFSPSPTLTLDALASHQRTPRLEAEDAAEEAREALAQAAVEERAAREADPARAAKREERRAKQATRPPFKARKAARKAELRGRMRKPIHGIPCNLTNASMRGAVESVLSRLQADCPDDYQAILGAVRSIDPLSPEQVEDGDSGWWRPEIPTQENQESWGWGHDTPAPGVLMLADGEHPHAVALVAHEFGHVVTLHDHLAERGDCPDDEWRSELTADWHASRWGYEEQLQAHRADLDWMHHGPAPGKTFSVSTEGEEYRVTVGLDYTVTTETVAAE